MGMPRVLLYLAATAALIMLTAVALRHRRAAFWLAFVPVLVPIAYVDRYHFRLPAGVKWLPFLCIAFAAGAVTLLLPRVRPRIPSSLLWIYAAILVTSGLSLLLNGSTVASFLVAQRGYVLVFCAIVALKCVYGYYGRDRLHAFLVTAGVLSALICVVQRLAVVPFVDDPDPGDRVTGLFFVGSITLFFHLNCIGIVLAYWMNGRRVIAAPPVLVLLLLVLALGVGNQKAAVPYLVALLGFLGLQGAWQAGREAWPKVVLTSVALPAVALLIFTPIYNMSYKRTAQTSYARSILDPEYISRYLFGDENVQFTPAGRLLRGGAVLFAYELNSTDPAHLLLGRGPGATSDSRLPGASGALSVRYPGWEIDRVALSMILAETGFVGVGLNVLFLLAIFAWRPGGRGLEPLEHTQVRRAFAFLALSYFVYGNMCYEPIYAVLAAVCVYPLHPPAHRVAMGRGEAGRSG